MHIVTIDQGICREFILCFGNQASSGKFNKVWKGWKFVNCTLCLSFFGWVNWQLLYDLC